MPVDLSGSVYAQFEKTRRRAEESNEHGNYADAANAYRQCGELMTQYAKYATDPVVKAKRLEHAQAYADMAAQVARGKSKSPASTQVDPATSSAEDYTGEIEALITQAPVTWDEIGGLDQTKDEIKQAYIISMVKPPAGVKLRAVRNMLFYGPPGTGKTLLAAATSKGLAATFFNVKVSNLLSKYFGESTKLITSLYAVARQRTPAVVFLDEVESLIPPRGGGGESGAERRVTSTLLVELDGLAQKGSDGLVLTIAATNVPWLIDKAMLSRFERKIYIPLPDSVAREAILRIHIEKQGYTTQMPYAELAKRTEGLAGREIERACKSAINHMIGRVNPDLLKLVGKEREEIVGYQLRAESLSSDDLNSAFGNLQPETTAKDLRKFEDWRAGEL